MNDELPMRFDNEYRARQPKMVLITLLGKPLLFHYWAKLWFGLSCLTIFAEFVVFYVKK